MRGRGAKHFFLSGSAPGGSLPEARFSLIRSRTSVQRPLIWCPNSHLVRSIMSMLRFWKFSSKSRKIRVRKRSLNRLIVLVSFINGDPLSDRSKSKVQTTSRQQPCNTPQMLFAKINYFSNKLTDISFSSLPDGKSASRNNFPEKHCDFERVCIFLKFCFNQHFPPSKVYGKN